MSKSENETVLSLIGFTKIFDSLSNEKIFFFALFLSFHLLSSLTTIMSYVELNLKYVCVKSDMKYLYFKILKIYAKLKKKLQ